MYECVQLQELFRIHATHHTRGQENMAFRLQANNVFDALQTVINLRASGYSHVRMAKIGKVEISRRKVDW